MPSSTERRMIDNFINRYNSNDANTPKILDRIADPKQEAPDAICVCEDGSKVALELTSAYPPKGKPGVEHVTPYQNLDPIHRIIKRKLLYDYRGPGIDLVWLVVHIRRTLPLELIQLYAQRLVLPDTYDRVFLQWPIQIDGITHNLGVLDLPTQQIWIPNISSYNS